MTDSEAERGEAPDPNAQSARKPGAVPALAAICFAMSLNQNVFAALNPFLGKEYGFSDDQLGALISAPGLAGAASALALGPLVDRVGRRLPLLVGTAVFLLGTLGYLFAEGFGMLVAARVLTGFAAGAVLTSASAAVADLVPADKRGKAMTLISVAILIAGVLGNPVAALIAQYGSWRDVFWLQIGIAVLSAFALSTTLPASLGRSGRPVGSPFAPLANRGMLPALASIALYTGAFVAVVQFFGVWLDERNLLTGAAQAWFWLALGLLGGVGGLALGGFIDKLGKHRAVVLASAVVTLGVGLLPVVGSLWTLALVGAPIAIVSAARSGALLALVTELVPEDQRARLMGLRSAAVNLGIGVVPWASGALRESSGANAFFFTNAIVLAVALLLVWRAVPRVT